MISKLFCEISKPDFSCCCCCRLHRKQLLLSAGRPRRPGRHRRPGRYRRSSPGRQQLELVLGPPPARRNVGARHLLHHGGGGRISKVMTTTDWDCNCVFSPQQVRTGSHLESCRAVVEGRADAAGIDCVTLEHVRWGPPPLLVLSVTNVTFTALPFIVHFFERLTLTMSQENVND